MDPRGRWCPLTYRYQPEALAQPAQLSADTLYVVGGLYGNLAALRAILERAEREPDGPATIVFNGDFHWLDVDPEDFQEIGQTVLAHHAIKGNVEAELASEEDAGCGCAYPDYVDDAVVDRSNQIMSRLRATASWFPSLVRRLGELPRHLTATVGGQRVGIVHGDPEAIPDGGHHRLVVNNGSAGLGNFTDTTYGVITRLSSSRRSPADSLYGTTIGTLRCDAVPVAFDPGGWKERFLAQWPPGSPGHRSYFTRVTRGTPLRLQQAARAGVRLTGPSGVGDGDGGSGQPGGGQPRTDDVGGDQRPVGGIP